MEMKFGDTIIKIPFEEFMKMMSSGENAFKSMIPKSNADFYHKFYNDMPKSMFKYYKELNRTFAKYLDISKHGIGKIPDSPDVLMANGHDIFNYVARYGLGNFQIQTILKFDGRLDFDRLTKAVRLSVDIEPVFGCRFVESNPPYWKRLENIDEAKFCSFEETDDGDDAVQEFLDSPMDMDNDPKIKVKLIRSKSYDILGIKANHACCDGTGIKEYVRLLSSIYSNADLNDGELAPIPRARGRKDQDKLFKALGISDPSALFIPGSDITIPTWAFPWKQGSSSTTLIVVSKLPINLLGRMSSYAKSKGATINDLLLTAYYRAMLKMGQPVYGVPMGVTVTIDLRRYLPEKKTGAIRNFSGAVSTMLSMIENEAFSDTLSRVVYMMNELKKGYPGLQSAIGLERLEKISFRDTLAYYRATSKVGRKNSESSPYYGDRCVPTLSNIGVISEPLIEFGNSRVNDIYIVPPVVSPPGFLLEVGTYNGIMTMTAGFFESTVSHYDVEKLLNYIKFELLEGCR